MGFPGHIKKSGKSGRIEGKKLLLAATSRYSEISLV
jgi:hypothetical protein